ncbi:hypothetical protein [Seonamhaeicola maritimus]|uniref:Uncharacterized protein n=1 Tax=Seonamhaeicola maritimus TaxID=2591822 RepID=A0A5C7GEM3_9FLAO|nr:hypothetical protein [Seonamhaeicola maritimus]TXG35138.1 hypothetical protein FUA22_15395 [Seonamhaeicola maritimus]
MKKIYLIAVVLITAFWGCQDDDYDKPNSFSDVGLYHSQAQAPLDINIFEYITFANLSQNFTHHEWTIDEGNFFLEGPFQWRDSMELYEKQIINPGETKSEEKTINVYFKKSGWNEVRMFNIFDEYVEFRGYSFERGYYTQPAENVAGKWVIDTTLMVYVRDTIVPEIEVKQGGSLLDITGTDTIYVEAGDALEFTDKTTIGEPTGRNWFIRTFPVDGQTEQIAGSNQEVANIVFKKLGVFQGGINVSRSGQNIPADNDRLIISRPFKVIPSSKPFELTGNIAEQEDESIRIPFNGEFTPFFQKEAFFEVKVNGTPFAIANVEVDADDATFLNITLEDPIYRPDVITVSLLDGSGIESTDTRTPVSFTDEPVIMHDVNLFPPGIASVEDGGFQGDDSWRAWWSNQGTVEVSSEQAASGSLSLKCTLVPGQNKVEIGCDFSQPIILDPDADYIFKYKRYIAPGSTISGTSGFWLLQNWGQKGWSNFGGEAQGEWIQKEFTFKQSQPISQIYARALLDGNADSDAVIYYDDFYIVKVEERP